jgi:Mn2+/Fe2+ NRAMP family transporter
MEQPKPDELQAQVHHIKRIISSLGPGLITGTSDDDPSGVINGLIAPPLLVLIMLVSNNKRVMGARVNSKFTNVIGWTAVVLMFTAALGMIVTWRQ